MKTVILLLCTILLSGCIGPLTDAQVQAVAKACSDIGLQPYVEILSGKITMRCAPTDEHVKD